MQHCPPELLLRIATYACTDDGRTGCALSEVSRYIRDASRRVRYHSLAIRSHRRLLALGELLVEAPTPFTVHHLFVSVWIPGVGPCRPRNKEGLLQALERVFEYASPTLRTLIVDAPRLKKSLTIRFPHLTDLSIDTFRSEPRAPDPHTFFPSLRRLHVADCRYIAPHELWRDLAAYAPTLTHLRLSCVEEGDELLHMLRKLLQWPSKVTGRDATVAIPEATPKLCYAWVQPGQAMSETLADGLIGLAEGKENTQEHSTVKFHLIRTDEEYYKSEVAFDDWLDLVSGGDGPWA
ncbi:hypothetical protein PHLGIDRAFT_355069 [Phlebiopsis gigantea 11061_1 CR5-6]|uniref:F-box domain-containing protein n=1 Tax=Phlebiopsis gigantea (strain 11061_1 CR5-6) TaxID=745531 RepID=A0A0C3PPP4_PHLG1|nr:hypothetical protein PHLGIDRAFT_355069 [Phlebiopsis gigantea 11061_1 CR5-6]